MTSDQRGAPATESALAVAGASKRFGSTVALDGVDVHVAPGSVRALVGANGSGKSTLIRALAGYHPLDAGSISVHGQELNVHQLAEHGGDGGLRFVHQDLALIPSLSVADNLAFGRGFARSRLGSISWKREDERVRAELHGVGLSVRPRAAVSTLGPVERTLVAVARALDHVDSGKNILVLDEPTARLPQEEAARLIARLQALKRRGLPILYVTHRLEELDQFADTVTVLRDGRQVFAGRLSALSGDELRELITGLRRNDAGATGYPERQDGEVASVAPGGPLALELSGVVSRRLKGIHLALRRGEVLGVTGLIGSGRSELGRVVYGLQRYTAGSIAISGRPAGSPESRARTSTRVGYIPQDRRAGLLAGLPVEENIAVTSFRGLGRWYGLSRRRLGDAAGRVIRTLRIRPDDPRVVVDVLSGGNQQKVALGKWLRLQLDLLILDEPTQSIDIGTKSDFMTAIRQRAQDQGLAVLWLESDIEELVKYADRILVMTHGVIGAEFSRPPFRPAEVLAEAYSIGA